MTTSAKITISLDADLLEEVEERRRITGQSRSQFFRTAAKQALRQEREEIEQYIRGYQEQPETAEEIELARQLGRAVLAQEPWE